MDEYVGRQLVKAMLNQGTARAGKRVQVMGLTFKENCSYLHNTRVVYMFCELQGFGFEVDVHDSWAEAALGHEECGLTFTVISEAGAYDAVVLAVAHD